VAIALVLLLPAGASSAATQARAGVYTGYAFDACSAPSIASLQAWAASPYRGVGIYIGGANRACKQSNLNVTWVQTTLSLGWSLLPLYVGLQAPCVSESGLAKISTSVTAAATQGRTAADDAAANAESLGLPGGSPIWLDLEGYRLGNATCTKAVQSFVAGWNDELRGQGFVPGVYGSAASTIRDVGNGGSPPDLVWIANWNGVESVFGDPYVSDSLWPDHQRVHQYKGGHKETYGGVTINIDSSVVDSAVVGGGVPPAPPPTPAPAGQVNSGDGLATASWPAEAFGTQVAVTLTPAGQPPAPTSYAVQLSVTQVDDSTPVTAFGAPVTVHLLQPPNGQVPAFSADGVTWKAIPKLTGAGVSSTTPTAYSTDPDGTYEIQTLVPGWFGLVSDTTPPAAPVVAARLLQSGLYLSWQPALDNAGIGSYAVLKNGKPLATLAATARHATVRRPGAPTQSVYRVQATDAAGNVGKPSRAVVVLPKRRPAKLPRTVPQWAFALYMFQHGAGVRPAAAPKRPPAWYWLWAGWHALPYRLR
jgi:hypothetical protein